MTSRMFVYGSLMEGFFNHDIYLKGRVTKVIKAKTKGKLYHLENKGYPGMIPGDQDVYGELITMDSAPDLLEALDKLEGFRGHECSDNAYKRVPFEIEILESGERLRVDGYQYNLEAPCNQKDQRLLIVHGRWSDYMHKK